ncbi:mechanosensitive ion channel family protein [Nocardioides donggukensis]|uniref:Mechanosensitive ion channel n=1 Tax=Nocardioides donggukensis TaxID=2774019 RepID=A0A927Q0C6_9ACTN|nr:hypothetical protein [Nocardioides donggukensis]MBD8868757.1 hypothetical protein [Nocardioides donggukensis]
MSRSTQAVDVETGLTDAWSSIASFVPKLLVFLLVLLVAWLIAKAVSKAVGLLLEKIGFMRLLDRAGVDDTLRNAQIQPVSLITKLVYYFILLIGLQLALTAFGPTNPVSAIINDIVAWLPKAFVAIVILIVAAAVAGAVKDIMGASLGGLSYGPLLTKIVGGFIIALGVIAALNQVGIGLSVTLPVLIAVLATIGGILVVGVGGGLIGPMRQRWEGWLGQLEQDTREHRASGGTSAGATSAGTGSAGTGSATTQMPPVN